MREAVIVDAVRTPLGRGKPGTGQLSGWHAADLGAVPLRALLDRTGIDPEIVDDVIMGCVMQVGEQAGNIARASALIAGLPESVPGTTVDRQCGSSQQSAHFAAQGVIAGAYDVVVAAGVEVMSRVPMGASMMNGPGFPMGSMVQLYIEKNLYGKGGLVQQGTSAEIIAEKWGISREELDAFSAESHKRAARATEEGRFENEILPVEIRDQDGKPTGETMTRDEGIRPDTTAEKLAGLKPSFDPNGVITAGNSSQITDGASALLIMERSKAEELGLKPRARFHTFAVAGVDPVIMLTGPIPATTKVLERSGLTMDDIDLFEVNEAFAPVVVAWAREHNADLDKVNVNGGAIAVGHPLGASGARLMTTLLNELERTGGRYGLQTMCEGGGMANATIIERL
ncbi:MAG: thiolase family protein [Actinobacteria bacterium ATB1]|nr:thiolase family protein [Actinobacteria bacterium ATB1]